MAQNIPTFFVDEYRQRIELALQHSGSQYRAAVSEMPASGEQSVAVDLVGMVPMKPITHRLQPIVNDDFKTDRVWMRPSDAYAAPIIDTFDKLRLGANDPQSVVVRATVNGARKHMDQLIASAFFADAIAGRKGEAVVPFDTTAHRVDAAVGASADTGLNGEKLLEAARIMREADVDVDNEELWCAITPRDNQRFLADARVTNSEFVKFGGVVVKDKVTNFAGMNVLVTNVVPDYLTYTAVPVWVKSGITLGVWDDVKVSIDQRTDIAGLPFQVHVTVSLGATRTEPGKVILVECTKG